MISQIPTLPDAPKPPHDPLHLLLDARIGWQEAAATQGVEESRVDGSLQLAPKPANGNPLVDAAGTFGGIELPTGVAADDAGNIWLLDAASGKIKRFDPCECRFEEVPCTGGIGSAPRQFLDPHGIEIFCGNLFVCDTGNARVQVFALKGMTLRALWQTPLAANLSQPWKPYDIAFDGRGRAFVTDNANGVVHRFGRRGDWQIKFGALNQPTHLALSHDGRVYVVQAGAGNVAIFQADGQVIGTVDRPDKFALRYCPAGIATDTAGNLYLGDRCALHRFHCCAGKKPSLTGTIPLPSDPSAIAFDLHGTLLVLSPAQKKVLQFAMTAFVDEGTYLSQPLDSELYRCQWHRIVFHGDIPDGAQVLLATFTAETPLDSADIANLSEVAWKTQQRVATTKKGAWDCLITSPPGRFLYLRLTLRGNGAVTPRLERIKLFLPRISLRRYLPAVFGENPVSADFTDRMLAVFDTIFRSVETQLDHFARYLDPMSTPAERDPRTLADFLTWLASWMSVILDRSWDERRRRLFLRDAWLFHKLRGTLEGLRRQLLLYLGWAFRDPKQCACAARREAQMPLILEHFKLRRWLFLGEARLGEQSVLWGKRIVNRTQLNETAQVGATQLIGTPDPVRDPFHVYAHKFSVFVPASCARSDDRRASIERLISLGKPAHTAHQLELVHPRFRIGFQSAIGLDSVVGQYPEGFTLDRQRLGYDTVLGESANGKGPPSLQIGTRSRIGTTTILD
jgi:phage tail-like protein